MMKSTLWLLTILLIATQAFACGGGEDPPGECDPTVDPVMPFVFPSTIYTGHNGRDTYTSAVSANFIAGEWQVADPGIATITPTGACQSGFFDISALIDIAGVGTTTVSAVDGSGNQYTSTLISQNYTTADYDMGQTVYMEANADGTRPSCGSCHLSPDGADHTPLTTAYFPDDVLLEVITTGSYPDCLRGSDGTVCQCGADPNDFDCYELGPDERDLSISHAWQLTPEEQAGVVVYLRGLRPAGF
jgi:cytochrome c553